MRLKICWLQHCSKLIKNIGYPMTKTFKLLKEIPDRYIILIWNHNHPVLSFHVLSFKDISPSTALKIKGLLTRVIVQVCNFYVC